MRVISIQDTPVDQVIAETIAVLKAGGVVVYPTETTYGIGAVAQNQDAVNKLLKYKKRRQGKPLSVAVADETMATSGAAQSDNETSHQTPSRPSQWCRKTWGCHAKVESDRCGWYSHSQISTHFGHREAYGKGMTTGAESLQARPYNVEDIFSSISDRQKSLIDLVLDAGELPHNEPSTVIDTTLDDVTVLRQGEVKFSEKTDVVTHSADETQKLGTQLVRKYKSYWTYKSLIFCLEGEMGVGRRSSERPKGLTKFHLQLIRFHKLSI
jgi:L-threonylcarbamoyladenylate synthase